MQTQQTCHFCGVALTDANWYPCFRRRPYYACKRCYWEKIKPYRQRNRITLNEYQKASKRKHEIVTNGKTYRSKEDINRPDTCSLCGTNRSKAAINFHHWKENPLTGMWVCRMCHNIIHLRGLKGMTIDEWFARYMELKETPIVLANIKTKIEKRRWP